MADRRERSEDLIISTGLFRQRSVRLKEIADHVLLDQDGDAGSMLAQEMGTMCSELLSLPGIGPETADPIRLFAAGKPRFVAAAHVSRILSRTGVFPGTDHEAVQAFVEQRILANTGSISRAGRPTGPSC